MATVKSYSVCKSEKGYGSPVPNSSVYSIGVATLGPDRTGRNGAYDHPTAGGLTEGRIQTLVNGNRTATDFPVSAIKGVTAAGSPVVGITSATAVIATTTTLTGNGAGLIVSFTTTAAGAANGTPGSYTVVNGGEGYATDDTVQLDGFVGSVLAVTAA